MTEKLIFWLKTYPPMSDICFYEDFLPAEPGNAGLYQKGLQELSRREDLLGNVTAICRYRFLLRLMVQDLGSWLPDFQNWVQQQSLQGLAPRFGDGQESLRAINGHLKEVSQPGTGVYEVELVAEFIKKYEENKL